MTNGKLKALTQLFHKHMVKQYLPLPEGEGRFWRRRRKKKSQGEGIKKFLHLTFVIFNLTLILCFSAFAEALPIITTVSGGDAGLSRVLSNIGGLNLGYVKEGSREVYNLQWQPDFKLGPFGLGLNVNYGLGDFKPVGYETVVVRYLKYDDGRQGLQYGVISNLTWGHGLLLKNYTNLIAGPIMLNNSQLAFLGYFDNKDEGYVVRGLWSKTGVAAARLEERINDRLTFGQTYIADNDGIVIGTTGINQKISAIGVDATYALPLGFEGYAEWARLNNYGSGMGVGVGWDHSNPLADASFSAGYRLLDKGFVPGYFGQDYETNPIDMTTAEATGNNKNGYLVEMNAQIMKMATLRAAYEKYNDSTLASLNADATARLPQNVDVTGYYHQPNFNSFRSISLEDGAIIGGSIAYPMNQFTKVVVHYKKAYDPVAAQVVSSQYYEVRFSF